MPQITVAFDALHSQIDISKRSSVQILFVRSLGNNIQSAPKVTTMVEILKRGLAGYIGHQQVGESEAGGYASVVAVFIMIGNFFTIGSVPAIFLYNKSGKFVKAFDRDVPVQKIPAAL